MKRRIFCVSFLWHLYRGGTHYFRKYSTGEYSIFKLMRHILYYLGSATLFLWIVAPKFDALLVTTQGKEQIDFKLLAEKFENGTLSLKEYMTQLSTSSPEQKTVKSNSSTVSSSKQIDQVLAAADKLKGTPYKFGGNDGYGIDCSGFTVYAYKTVGVSLPRKASKQFTVGTPVRKKSLQKGDLVFFQTQVMTSGPSHVGIYAGNNTFYHASSSKGVVLSDMSIDYYVHRYMGARRIIQ